MLSKEEYKKELVRMWDSLRSDISPYKGSSNCGGVDCLKCPIYPYCCRSDAHNAFEMIETVETWSKENPIITNRDKFKKVFGVDMNIQNDCGGIDCPRPIKCEECEYRGFWSREYKEPLESEG